MTWKVKLDAETIVSLPEFERILPAVSLVAGSMTSDRYPDSWWDNHHWNQLREAGKFADILSKITMTKPPDSAKTKQELVDIVKLQASKEFHDHKPEIIEEANDPPPYYLRAFFLDPQRRFRSLALFRQSVGWAVPFIMHFKHRWKRPRPNQLEPRISPVVDCPCHPAYPSGHSTQAHLVALVLGELSKQAQVKSALWDKADRIAQNREYAGLHYQSDSNAGAKLAQDLLPYFHDQFEKQMGTSKNSSLTRPVRV